SAEQHDATFEFRFVDALGQQVGDGKIREAVTRSAVGHQYGGQWCQRNLCVGQTDGVNERVAALVIDQQFHRRAVQCGKYQTKGQRTVQIALEFLYYRYAPEHAVAIQRRVIKKTAAPGALLQHLKIAGVTGWLCRSEEHT